ncbi:MAG: formylglycine-generating enzyme family protein [Mariprofundaceae bacterium]|nr:formylglycine-generating enzyme family protein [Mariprofundaceae bacterium]
MPTLSLMRFSCLFVLLCFLLSPSLLEAKTPWFNTIGMGFVLIPSGSFVMGSCMLNAADKAENARRTLLQFPLLPPPCSNGTSVDDAGSMDESPQHKVQIPFSFQLSRYEVTLQQFKLFIVDTGRSNFLSPTFLAANKHGNHAPVVAVSWEQVAAFIAWLNRKEGGHYYRLPTEAEWEYAARAGTRTHWPFKGRYRDYAWYEKNAGGHPHAVGLKKPNAWGLYDMAGNVWEWTQDWYDAGFYHQSPATNPSRLSSGESRVARGGGWDHGVNDLRAANRGFALPDQGYNFVGFRLARDTRGKK